VSPLCDPGGASYRLLRNDPVGRFRVERHATVSNSNLSSGHNPADISKQSGTYCGPSKTRWRISPLSFGGFTPYELISMRRILCHRSEKWIARLNFDCLARQTPCGSRQFFEVRGMDNSEARLFHAEELIVGGIEIRSSASPKRKKASANTTPVPSADSATARNDTVWDDTLPFTACLRERKAFGHGYREGTLETKRRQAITWLREQSKTGWTCDRVQIYKNRADQSVR
jgi:hypothetical protein